MEEEILAVRFYRQHVITIAREEEQTEEVTFVACDSVEAAMDEIRAQAEAKDIEVDVPTLQSYSSPLLADRHKPTERKIVSDQGFNFGLSITRG